MNPALERRLEAVCSKAEIEEQLRIFCRGADRNDVDIMMSAFHPDAQADWGWYKGDALGFCTWVAETHKENFVVTSHQISNVIISLKGNTASSEGHMDSRLRYHSDNGFNEILNSVRYLSKWERRDEAWKMVHHMAVIDKFRTVKVECDPKLASLIENLPAPSVGEKDLSYDYITI